MMGGRAREVGKRKEDRVECDQKGLSYMKLSKSKYIGKKKQIQ